MNITPQTMATASLAALSLASIPAKADTYIKVGYNQTFHQENIIDFRDLSPEKIAKIASGELTETVILKVNKGETIPFTVNIEGNIISLKEENPSVSITAQQDFYIRYQPDQELLEFSIDNLKWMSLEDFVTGNFSVNLACNDHEKLEGGVDLVANLRKV